MTDAVVLAAGLGRRLATATTRPKWLVSVNGSCPADVHLRAFELAGIDRVLVVVAPEADEIEGFLGPWRERVATELVVNNHSADRNNWYSLLLALECWSGVSGQDLVVVNSDLFAHVDWFTKALGEIRVANGSAALAVDPTRGRSDEAMKVGLDPSRSLLTAIGKVGIEDPGGEYVGLAWWSSSGAAELREVLAGFQGDPSCADHWYEHGIQRHVEAGGSYAAVAVPSAEWVEIDDERDLEAARRLRTVPGGSSLG